MAGSGLCDENRHGPACAADPALHSPDEPGHAELCGNGQQLAPLVSPAPIRKINEPIALYIHWPFCLSRCPYCDFNAHVRDVIPQQRFRDALRRELAWEAERIGRRSLRSIFFGGGTPSLMEPETVARLLQDARTLFDCPTGSEITLEANPTSVETSRLAA